MNQLSYNNVYGLQRFTVDLMQKVQYKWLFINLTIDCIFYGFIGIIIPCTTLREHKKSL